MKISLPINQFFDDTGLPLVAGRVSIFTHDSDTICKVFTLSGDIYREAVNPIITSEDGRIPTLFFDAAVVDVKVEKANGDGSYELIDTFQSGFNMPDATNDTVVNGIDALKDTNPDVGVVSVYGYDKNVVAPMRHYVWDSTCTDAADDGIVVLSNTTETGRWILLWDDEKLPCTVYGIVPGYETNISSFLGYPDVVSRWNIRTPRIPRFLPGTYTSNTTFTTPKSLYFDCGAKFVNARFVCSNVIIPSNTDYVADFLFTGENTVAHSCWFRSASWFWRSGAQDMYIDGTNHFVETTLSTVVNLTEKNIYGATRIPLTYSNGGYISFTRCNIKAKRLFDPSIDVLKFSAMDWDDGWWKSLNNSQFDFGLISQRHRLEFLLTGTLNRMDLDSCASADIWVARAKYELGQYGRLYPSQYVLDLRGRTVSSLDGDWRTFRNLRVDGTGNLTIAASYPTVLENVSAQAVYCKGNASITAKNSTLVFSEKFHGDALALTDCNVSGSVLDFIDVSVTTLAVYGGTFGSSKQTSRVVLPKHTGTWDESNYAKSKDMSFRNCVVGAPIETCGNISVDNCMVNQSIEMFPWLENGKWVSRFRLNNNTFYDAAKVSLDERAPIDESHVNGVTMSGVMTGNSFFQTDTDGFKVRLMDNQTSLVFFLDPLSTLVYSGNTGNCPVELAGRADYWDATIHQFGDILEFPNAKYRNRVERVAGIISFVGSVYSTTGYASHNAVTWDEVGDSGGEYEVKHITNPKIASERDNIRLMYMPLWFSDPGDANNDMFKVVLACGSNMNPPGWFHWLS